MTASLTARSVELVSLLHCCTVRYSLLAEPMGIRSSIWYVNLLITYQIIQVRNAGSLAVTGSKSGKEGENLRGEEGDNVPDTRENLCVRVCGLSEHSSGWVSKLRRQGNEVVMNREMCPKGNHAPLFNRMPIIKFQYVWRELNKRMASRRRGCT